METQIVSTVTSTLDDEALISAPEARRLMLGGISEVTEWRWAKQFPDFPKIIRINRRKYYRLGDIRKFTRTRAAA